MIRAVRLNYYREKFPKGWVIDPFYNWNNPEFINSKNNGTPFDSNTFISEFGNQVYTGLGYCGIYRRRGHVVLAEITDIDTLEVFRISTEFFNLTHKWKDHIHSIDSPSYQIDNAYGGYVRPNFGGISLSPETFGYYPPKRAYLIKVLMTASTEEAAEIIYEGSIYLESISEESLEFTLVARHSETYILSEATDYQGNNVVLPIAFGYSGLRQAVRLPDVDGKPTYSKAGITGTLAKEIESVVDNGSGYARFNLADHGFLNGETVIINGTFNYNGSQAITSVSTDYFDTDKAYVEEDFSVEAQHVYKEGNWGVFDGARPIAGNVIDNGDNTFSLTANPVDTVFIFGYGENDTLFKIFDMCKDMLGYTLNDFYGTDTSVAFWQDSQMTLIEFMSMVSSSFTHCFTIKDTQVNLYDMLGYTREYILSEFRYFESPKYNYPSPLSILKTSWQEQELVEDDAELSRYIKTVDYEGTVSSEFTFGEEKQINILHHDKTIINTFLSNALGLMNSCQVSLPITDEFIPIIGDKITFVNNSHYMPVTAVMKVRGIQLNTPDAEIIVTGDAVIS